MSHTPAVSIVFPVYNARQWIEEAVASVFAQTLTDWELLAVDDASTDGSWEYLQRLEDPRVRLARNERNLRHGATLNRAIEMARGQWIARMDADDVILPTRLERQVGALEGESQIDVLGCGIFQVDIDLQPVNVRRPVTSDAVIKRWPTIRYPLTYGSLVGKAAWWKHWRVEPRAIYSTSFELFLRSHRETTFGNIRDPLYVYRYVGHTRNLPKMTRAVWDRAKTLSRLGFRMGPRLALHTLLGLTLLAPRPLVYAVKQALGSQTAIVPSSGEEAVTAEDRRILAEGLTVVRNTRVPLKPVSS
ncbi:MAG: glycosyltransferase family 2 protein [Phycisphaerae bacterium]|nr:glycosyltransferase family 2 protein [Phycisphaerae bacterium]